MISINLTTPREVTKKIANRARERRLAFDLSQRTLSQKSGVSYGALKKFEQTGQIALESLLKLALTLGSLSDFDHVFTPSRPEEALSLDELIQQDQTRKRGRK